MGVNRVNSMLRTNVLTKAQQDNSELNAAEFSSGTIVLRSAPRRILFEITNRCNFRCVMCGRNFDDFQFSDMNVEVIKKFAPIYDIIEEVTLFGWGESMLHPRFDEILRYLGGYPSLRKYLLTNGSLPEKTVNYVKEGLLDIVSVSMDGATPATLERIRAGARMDVIEKTVTGIAKLAKGGRQYVNLVFLLFNSNIHELPLMLKICADWGVPELKVIYLTAFDDTLVNETMWYNDGSYKKYFAKAQEEADRWGINLRLPDLIGECSAGSAPHKPCETAWKDLFVGCDQSIRPCLSTNELLTSVKDYEINSWDDFMAIWNSPPFQVFRSAVNDDSKMSSACRTCYQCSYANWNKQYAHVAVNFQSPFGKQSEIS